MYWSGAENVGTNRTEDWLLDACENAIQPDQRVGGDPQIRAIATPSYVDFGLGLNWRFPLALLLCDSTVILGRKKGFGKRSELRNWFRYDFLKYGVDHRPGLSLVTMVHRSEGPITFHFHTPAEAEYLGHFCALG